MSLNLLDSRYFPSFDELPYDNDLNEDFFQAGPSGVYAPSHHWAYLGEITEDATMKLGSSISPFGLRIESMSGVQVLPFKLQDLLDANGEDNRITLDNKSICSQCSAKDSKLVCARCRAPYCSKDCQVTHWNTSHKATCRRRSILNTWKARDWTTFNNFWNVRMRS
ncbi:hypothetical protein DL96DRAFT_1620817 [Flagelloscypha sp. PMI_526]|nr:hypothetical protein DL96DRAFT_1620817 [Flagelloscypha sp. PMI_526]